METIITFLGKPENAIAVKEHLFDVELNGDCLIFSTFDKEVFKFAVALEGLNRRDYAFVCSDPNIQSKFGFLPCKTTVVLKSDSHGKKPAVLKDGSHLIFKK